MPAGAGSGAVVVRARASAETAFVKAVFCGVLRDEYPADMDWSVVLSTAVKVAIAAIPAMTPAAPASGAGNEPIAIEAAVVPTVTDVASMSAVADDADPTETEDAFMDAEVVDAEPIESDDPDAPPTATDDAEVPKLADPDASRSSS